MLSPGIVAPLAARLAPPRLDAGRVPRERLMRRLRSVPNPAVQIVHAPPGYGKSTLVAQFAAAEEREVVWLTLNERDGDPVTFVADLVFALGDDDDAATELLESLAAGPSTIVPSALPRLISMLGRHHDVLIVLDDIHLAASPGAGDVVTALVDHLPAGSTLVLVGRVRPDLPISRLVAAGHLAEIDARELRMTVGEGAAMVRDQGVVLDQHQAELVVRRTEGWPAALYLVARAVVENAMRADDVPERGDGLGVYLRDEVLSGVDASHVRFLLDSSILEELQPADCDAILERSNSARELESLADADLFVESLDAHGDAYRVHGLFREALLDRLRNSDPKRADGLNRRAAEHYMQRGEIESAVRHALAAGEGKLAADLVWCTAPAYEAQGRSATLKRWLEWFSPAQFDENPCLALAAGWVAIDDGDGDAAQHWTTVALAAPPDIVLADEAPMGAAAQLLDAALGKHGVRAVREAAASADDLLPEASPWRAAAKLLGGAAAYAAADRETARSLLLDAQARGASSLPAVYKLSLGELALMAIDEDDWEEAESCMARARLTERHGLLRDYATQSICSAIDALIHAHRGVPIAARGAASDAKRALAAQRHYGPWFAAQGRLILAAAFVELDASADARMMLGEARALVHDDADAAHLHRWAEELAGGLEGSAGSLPEGEALSTAELRTLQYLQTHLTQAEIGDRLFVTRNTVKTHTGALYRKLRVTTRSAAVERGLKLGLLEGPSAGATSSTHATSPRESLGRIGEPLG